jgi:hypothetical protein
MGPLHEENQRDDLMTSPAIAPRRRALAGKGLLTTAIAAGFLAGAPALASHHEEMKAQKSAMMSETSASDLRVSLTQLLGEHALLASAATGAALGGRTAEFEAAAAALDANSVDLSNAIGSVYGKGAEDAFLPLWRTHIGFFVDYTMSSAKKDAAGKKKAVADLMGYAEDFGAFLNSANPNLPKDAVAGLVREHVKTLAAVVDAQAKGDLKAAYMAERTAFMHMQHISDALASAIAAQFPDRFM